MKETKIAKWKCSICGKRYETYVVLFCDNPFCFASELAIREKYYNSKKKKGLCKECRDKL